LCLACDLISNTRKTAPLVIRLKMMFRLQIEVISIVN